MGRLIIDVDQLIVPLYLFDVESADSINLGNGEQLILLDMVEHPAIPKRDYIDEQLPQGSQEPLWAMIMNQRDPSTRRTMDRGLTALKLVSSHFVHSHLVWPNIKNEKRRDGWDVLPHYIPFHDPRTQDPYLVTEGDIGEIVSQWRPFVELNRVFALGHYHMADYRPYLEDMYLDYVNCLESLFIPEATGGELRFKFRTRGSAVLGSTPEERKELFDLLAKVYDLRSKIVHGRGVSREDLEGKNKHPGLDWLRSTTRAAIVYFAREGLIGDPDKVMEHLLEVCVYRR